MHNPLHYKEQPTTSKYIQKFTKTKPPSNVVPIYGKLHGPGANPLKVRTVTAYLVYFLKFDIVVLVVAHPWTVIDLFDVNTFTKLMFCFSSEQFTVYPNNSPFHVSRDGTFYHIYGIQFIKN